MNKRNDKLVYLKEKIADQNNKKKINDNINLIKKNVNQSILKQIKKKEIKKKKDRIFKFKKSKDNIKNNKEPYFISNDNISDNNFNEKKCYINKKVSKNIKSCNLLKIEIPNVQNKTYKKKIYIQNKFDKKTIYNENICSEESFEYNKEKIKIHEFSYNDLYKASNGFNEKNIIGKGYFSYIYKGILNKNKKIAIKVLKSEKNTGFLNEINILSNIEHVNIIKLLGYCDYENIKILVYELLKQDLKTYMNEHRLKWFQIIYFSLQIVSALNYLHNSDPSIIHRDIKSENILLDKNNLIKISDFGLAIIKKKKYKKIKVKQPSGTFGYADPYYILTCLADEKTDVYSFGIVLIELLIGKLLHINDNDILSYRFTFDNIFNNIDKRIHFPSFFLIPLIHITIKCTHKNVHLRPTFNNLFLFFQKINEYVKLYFQKNTLLNDFSYLNNEYKNLCNDDNKSINKNIIKSSLKKFQGKDIYKNNVNIKNIKEYSSNKYIISNNFFFSTKNTYNFDKKTYLKNKYINYFKKDSYLTFYSKLKLKEDYLYLLNKEKKKYYSELAISEKKKIRKYNLLKNDVINQEIKDKLYYKNDENKYSNIIIYNKNYINKNNNIHEEENNSLNVSLFSDNNLLYTEIFKILYILYPINFIKLFKKINIKKKQRKELKNKNKKLKYFFKLQNFIKRQSKKKKKIHAVEQNNLIKLLIFKIKRVKKIFYFTQKYLFKNNIFISNLIKLKKNKFFFSNACNYNTFHNEKANKINNQIKEKKYIIEKGKISIQCNAIFKKHNIKNILASDYFLISNKKKDRYFFMKYRKCLFYNEIMLKIQKYLHCIKKKSKKKSKLCISDMNEDIKEKNYIKKKKQFYNNLNNCEKNENNYKITIKNTDNEYNELTYHLHKKNIKNKTNSMNKNVSFNYLYSIKKEKNKKTINETNIKKIYDLYKIDKKEIKNNNKEHVIKNIENDMNINENYNIMFDKYFENDLTNNEKDIMKENELSKSSFLDKAYKIFIKVFNINNTIDIEIHNEKQNEKEIDTKKNYNNSFKTNDIKKIQSIKTLHKNLLKKENMKINIFNKNIKKIQLIKYSKYPINFKIEQNNIQMYNNFLFMTDDENKK